MTATLPIVSKPRPHTGQVPILADPARFKILRCGRRFGKSATGIIQTLEEFTRERDWGLRWGPRVGWFTPLDRYTTPVFEELRDRLGPMVQNMNANTKTLGFGRGAVIECWTMHNNPEAGRSRKYDLAVVDEAGLITGLRKWYDTCLRPTLMDTRGRLLMLGTPHAISPDFNDFFDEAEAGKEGWRAFQTSTFDNPHIPADEKAAIMAARENMPEWLWKQEYLGIPADNAAGIFGRQTIRAYIEEFARPPTWKGRIGLDPDDEWMLTAICHKRDLSKILAFDDARGPWSVWGEPDDERQGEVCIGVDLSAGVGSSNTTMSVGLPDIGLKFAEFASPGVTPEEAARIAAMAGYYFGGENPAWIWYEANGGGGEQFGRELLRLKYPRIRGRTAERWEHAATTNDKLGWWSTEPGKESMILAYAAALKGKRIKNPSEAALRECLTFIYHRGKVVSINPASDGLEELAGAPHGDRVIADALLVNMMRWCPKTPAAPERKPPPESIGARIAADRKPKRRYAW